MANGDKMLELVADIYRAVEVPELWPTFLERLGHAIDATGMALHVENSSPRHGQIGVAVGLDPAYLQTYDQHYASVNVWMRRGRHLFRAGKVVTGEMVVNEIDFSRTEYLNDWLRPQGFHHGLGAILLQQQSHMSFLSALRSKSKGPFAGEVIALINALMPHLQRAFQLHHLLGAFETRALSLASVSDRIHRAVLLIDSKGRVTFMNQAASRLTAMRDGLTVERGELRSASAAGTTRLRSIVAEAVNTSSGSGFGAGGMLAIGRPSGRRPFLLLVCPVSQHRTLFPGVETAAAMVFVTDPEQRCRHGRRHAANALRSNAGRSQVDSPARAGLLADGSRRATRVAP